MNSSLNEIAESIAYSMNKQFDITFKEVIKYNINHYREKLLREENFNNNINIDEFSSTLIFKLEEKEDELGCSYKITKEKIPSPVRFKNKGKSNYNYIGNKLGNIPFIVTNSFEYSFIKHLPHQINPVYYSIENQKIKLLNNTKYCEVRVDGVFANPTVYANFCENPTMLNDDAPYPISGEMINTISKMIKQEVFPLVTREEEGVLKTNSENRKNEN